MLSLKKEPKEYRYIDMDKVKTIKDMKVLIEAFVPNGIQVAVDYSKMDKLKHLLKD